MNKIIEKIKNNIKEKEIENSKVVVNYEGVEAVPIKKEYFSKIFNNIEEKERERREKIVFIDGGNAEILTGVDFALHFIRVFGVVFKGNERKEMIKKEYYCLATNKEKKVYVDVFDLNGNAIRDFSFDLFDNSLSTDIVSLTTACNAARRFLEVDFAKNINCDVIILDGSLQARVNGEEKLLKDLKETKKPVIGFCKSTSLVTDTGLNIITALLRFAPFKEWFYYPLIQGKNEKFFADLYVVKLNEKSNFAFRIDSFNVEDVEKILMLLKINAKDSCFLGYPYGLVFADRFARVTNKEKEFLKTKFVVNVDQSLKKSIDLFRVHDILTS